MYIFMALALGCVNSRPAARGSQEAGLTQPRAHLIAHFCKYLRQANLLRTRVLSEGPVPLQYGPEREGRGEYAEEEVGEGEGDDEGVSGVCPELGRGEDDGEDDEVEDDPGEHDGDVDADDQLVDRGGDLQVPQDVTDVLQEEEAQRGESVEI